MYKSSVVDFYGSQRKIARALGISDQAVSHWKSVIPEKAALRLERITSGALKYDASLYRKTYAPDSQYSDARNLPAG
ncbi:Cro/CI family transcriptional regulator [Xenorhabdus sp. XENO-1]|uniref:Cro/CI family transcriptional regulator n=1 Tax=Xenorhabdus bovienii TaxID=40576 RepID=UPI0020CA29B0|nr:Cro/CI family transcriptional regulator [Xenorhabdus bovienii]MCP9270430.1 Cro/CI family transcriptional regulator [Xenorhabdus bovienii subsp. africana]